MPEGRERGECVSGSEVVVGTWAQEKGVCQMTTREVTRGHKIRGKKSKPGESKVLPVKPIR